MESLSHNNIYLALGLSRRDESRSFHTNSQTAESLIARSIQNEDGLKLLYKYFSMIEATAVYSTSHFPCIVHIQQDLVSINKITFYRATMSHVMSRALESVTSQES